MLVEVPTPTVQFLLLTVCISFARILRVENVSMECLCEAVLCCHHFFCKDEEELKGEKARHDHVRELRN